MGTTRVEVKLRDSAKPGLAAAIETTPRSTGNRVGRGVSRFLMVVAIGAATIPIPIVHFCVPALSLIAAPVVAYLAFRSTVTLSPGLTPCPGCAAPLKIPADTPGWPAQLHCQGCGAMIAVRPAIDTPTS